MRCLGGVVTLLGVTGCVAPVTQRPSVSPAAVAAEERLQLGLALRSLKEHEARLWDVSWPLLTAATAFCPGTTRLDVGLGVSSIHSFEPQIQSIAAEALALQDTVQVVRVARGSPAHLAGVVPGDLVLGVNGARVGGGPDALPTALAAIQGGRGRDAHLEIMLRRGSSAQLLLSIPHEEICDYGLFVNVSNDLNAFATGNAVVVNTGLMRFTDDDELVVVLAHELAHNFMGHIEAAKSNTLLGAILGAVADVAVSYSTGTSTGGAYARLGGDIGRQQYSQEFESEADYVGAYLMAQAGFDGSSALDFWRGMAIANPGSISLSTSHPTTAERFVRLDRTLTEIAGKQARGLVLMPEGLVHPSAPAPLLSQPQDRVALQSSERLRSPIPPPRPSDSTEVIGNPVRDVPRDTIAGGESPPPRTDQELRVGRSSVGRFAVSGGPVFPLHPYLVSDPWRVGLGGSIRIAVPVGSRASIRVAGTYAHLTFSEDGFLEALPVDLGEPVSVAPGEESASLTAASVELGVELGDLEGAVRPSLYLGLGVGRINAVRVPYPGDGTLVTLSRQAEIGPAISGGGELSMAVGGIAIVLSAEHSMYLLPGWYEDRGYPQFLRLQVGVSTRSASR